MNYTNAIAEVNSTLTTTALGANGCNTTAYNSPWQYGTLQYGTYQTYPIYITSDKTAKAIDILKMLQAEKVIDVKSVPRFIELVEKIKAAL